MVEALTEIKPLDH